MALTVGVIESVMARLRLDRTLPPGQHVVTASPAVVTLAGQPLDLPIVLVALGLFILADARKLLA